ncbi:MAG: glycosyltransferase [Candidatus Omnitrophota bacterium]
MRILNVIMCLDPIGGGGSVERVYQLSKYLALAGEDCAILTTRQGHDQEYIRKLGNVKVLALPYISKRFRIPIGIFRWLRRNIRNYDVVHLAMNWTVINVITYFYLLYYKRPYVYSAMGWLTIDGRSKFIKRIYRALFTQGMVRHAKMCIAVTKREVEEYEKLGVDHNNISLIPNGLTVDQFLTVQNDEIFRAVYHIDSRPFILFIGRLNLIKGPDLLIQAFAAIQNDFPDYQLIIAGNNYGFLDVLKRLVLLYKINNKVTFLDPIFGREKFSAYRSADLFVIPSRFDTMTIVALEAAASGAPVLLTKQCDFDELQQAGGGLAVEATVEGLAKGLRILLSNRGKLKEMGKQAKEYVLKTYDWNHVCRQWVEVFQKVKI